MDRRFRQLIFSAALSASTAFAQNNSPAPNPAPSAPPKPPPPAMKPPGDQRKPDEFEDARRVFEKLPPEQREHFRENFQRWKEMPSPEKEALRDREQFRRERMAQEIDESIRKSGLQLDPDHREVYALRYAQERRKIEEKLRKEMEEKRKPLLDDMMKRLKAEFGAMSSASPSPT